MGRKLLAGATVASNWTGIAGALEGLVAYRGEPLDRWTVMGLSGHAFRLAIDAGSNGIAAPESPICFDFGRALRLYANLGYTVERFGGRPADADYARRREEAIRRVKRSIDRGRPAIVYGLHLPEFGLVKGYDESAGLWYVSSTVSSQYGEALPLAQWPAPGSLEWVEVLWIGDRRRVAPAQARRDALAFAVDYAQRGDAGGPAGTAHGFAAYERWLSGYAEAGSLDAFGNARCIQVVQAARRDAARYLREIARDYGAGMAAVLNQAAAAYDAQALAFSRLATLFPYPNGGSVDNEGTLAAGAASLRQAFEHEQVAISLLEQCASMI